MTEVPTRPDDTVPTRPADTTALARRPLAEANREPAEPVFRGLARLVHGACTVFTRRSWYDSQKLPATGGVIVVSNHMSYMDAPVLGEYLIWSGRWPRYLGKAELWKVPVVGWLARRCGQIPVRRESSRAGEALVAATEALHLGRAVTIFPEGTETHDPELWPMDARTGAARLALQAGRPVVPVAQWGAQLIMPGRRPTFPRLLPRKRVQLVCGDPVDLDDLRPLVGTDEEADAAREATDRIMDALTTLLAGLRGEQPPADGRWNQAAGRRLPRD